MQFKQKSQVFGNFLTFKWQFSGGSGQDDLVYNYPPLFSAPQYYLCLRVQSSTVCCQIYQFVQHRAVMLDLAPKGSDWPQIGPTKAFFSFRWDKSVWLHGQQNLTRLWYWLVFISNYLNICLWWIFLFSTSYLPSVVLNGSI